MKFKLQVFVPLLICLGCSSSQVEGSEDTKSLIWTNEMALEHISNREDSTKWDYDMFNSDLANVANYDFPFVSGVFPTPEYDLLGENSFKGVGNYGLSGGEGLEIKVEDKTILFNSFFVGKNSFNKDYLDANQSNEIFFHIVVLTDFVDTVNYSHLLSEIVSRNHPDYIGQGFYKTQDNRIDYSAFITANRNAYAIVNMRLFDLTHGKTILIAPQKDRSFRTKQIKSPNLSSEEIDDYTRSLLKKEEIIRFFSFGGSI